MRQVAADCSKRASRFRFSTYATIASWLLVGVLSGLGCSDGSSGDDARSASDASSTSDGGQISGDGAVHTPVCGDGIVEAPEECEDGVVPPVDGDGCNSFCRVEDGYVCATVGQPCRATVCGDGKKEGSEACDDGNNDMGDGCTPLCQVEPDCSSGACTTRCGDGIKLPSDTEECDDGNTSSGDGCSATCTLEAGFTCEDQPNQVLEQSLVLPIVIRDFGPEHPDFELKDYDPTATIKIFEDAQGKATVEPNIVAASLDPTSGKPRYNSARSPASVTTTTAANFDQWYRDVSGVNQTEVQSLTLSRIADGVYQFDSTSFFPIDGKLGGNFSANGTDYGHNYHFTSEVRYWFEYRGDELLTFRGDDDVWVFINGQLAVDLGGIHGPIEDSVRLDSAAATKYGLEKNNVYEIVVFQAERHVTGSNYRLTLAGFTSVRTVCGALCGDGIVARTEQCDDGNNVSGDGCSADCISEITLY